MKKRSVANATPLEQALTIAVASLKEGEVVSYGDIAERAGRPDAPRAAGALLSRGMTSLPWWRVVYASGKLAPCDPDTQQEKLETEGVLIRRRRVVRAPLGRFAKP
jgi:methylated-DNA-protein-cysteine methyltransferase-like protein